MSTLTVSRPVCYRPALAHSPVFYSLLLTCAESGHRHCRDSLGLGKPIMDGSFVTRGGAPPWICSCIGDVWIWSFSSLFRKDFKHTVNSEPFMCRHLCALAYSRNTLLLRSSSDSNFTQSVHPSQEAYKKPPICPLMRRNHSSLPPLGPIPLYSHFYTPEQHGLEVL